MCLNTLLAKMHAAGAAKQMEATPGEHFLWSRPKYPSVTGPYHQKWRFCPQKLGLKNLGFTFQ